MAETYLDPRLLGPPARNALNDPWAWRSDMDAPKIEHYLRQGPAPTGHDKVFDSIYGWLGGLPENRSTASALSNLFDVGTLGMATGAYDGARELAETGRPSALAMALMPGARPVSKVIPKTAVEARKAAAELWRAMRASPHEYHGVRATEAPLPAGERAPASYVWDDGSWTDTPLPGASTIGVDPYKSTEGPGSIPWALERMGFDAGQGSRNRYGYYPGPHVSIIGGDRREFGEDLGEWVIDGSVVGLLPDQPRRQR